MDWHKNLRHSLISMEEQGRFYIICSLTALAYSLAQINISAQPPDNYCEIWSRKTQRCPPQDEILWSSYGFSHQSGDNQSY